MSWYETPMSNETLDRRIAALMAGEWNSDADDHLRALTNLRDLKRLARQLVEAEGCETAIPEAAALRSWLEAAGDTSLVG